MTINYIILCHRFPEQVGRLVRAFSAPGTRFYIHVERTTDIAPFFEAVGSVENVHFMEERETSPYGHVGIVKATLHAMERIVKDGHEGACVLLSGQDYRVKSNERIRALFQGRPDTVFMDVIPFPDSQVKEDGFIKPLSTMLPRIEHYKFNHATSRGAFIMMPSIWTMAFWGSLRSRIAQLRFLSSRTDHDLRRILTKRRFPNYVRPHYGGQWWSMPTSVAKEVIAFVKEHPDYLKFHEYSLLPDEMFFQPIIVALKDRGATFDILPSTTYVDWVSQKRPRPQVMRVDRFKDLVSQPEHVLFARKFETAIDRDIFDMIDKHIASGSGERSN